MRSGNSVGRAMSTNTRRCHPLTEDEPESNGFMNPVRELYERDGRMSSAKRPLERPSPRLAAEDDLDWPSALGGSRTPNLLIRSQMLYPLSYERLRANSLREARGAQPVEVLERRGHAPDPHAAVVHVLALDFGHGRAVVDLGDDGGILTVG